MKANFLKTLLIALLPICAVSCIDNMPEEEVLPRDAVSFDYYIDQTVDPLYYLDYYIDSDITFVNTSPKTTAGTPTWDFGDGTGLVEGDTAIHYYSKAGTYSVKLKIGDYSKTQVVMIAPIKPIVYIKMKDVDCEVRKTLVSFEVELPNPKNKPASFDWIFPQGTKDKEGQDYLTFHSDTIVDRPDSVMFYHVGSQEVALNVKLGDEELEVTKVNVQVAYYDSVPTLYYAVQGGRIMAYKLTQGTGKPADMEIYPFDLGVTSGQHPFNILFKDSSLYVLDAGKQFYYVNDVNGVMGDGKISVISKEGKKVETMISNAGQAAFDDPFYGFIDGDYLYYANRNTGIMKVKLTDRDKMYNESEYPYFVRHNHLHYYGVGGLAYGAVSRNFAKIKGVWHWSTCHTATATFCFTNEDILKDPVTQGEKEKLPEEGKILDGLKIGSFYVNKDSVVFCAMGATANCIAACTYDEWKLMATETDVAKKAVQFNKMDFASNLDGNLPSIEGTGVESVGITQFAYDEVNNCAYFAYRNNGKVTDRYPNTGIYCYSFDTKEVSCILDGVSAYGVAVNNTPAKLF